MLNEQKIEQAARKLCEIRGLNPNDNALRMMSGGLKCLEFAANEIRAYLQVQEAVTYACETSRFAVSLMAEQMPCDCAPLTNCLKCGGSGTIQGRVEPL